MAEPAARVGDDHTCPIVDPGPKPHVGGPILPPGCSTVLIGGRPAARMQDMAVCAGPLDSIARGAFPATIGNMPAARKGDSTVHGGMITQGCPTVLIGLAGTTGNPIEGAEDCVDAANGRISGTTQQSYQNCGVETSRQIINRSTSASISENALLNQSMNSGLANQVPNNLVASGGTTPSSMAIILQTNGVPTTTQVASMEGLELLLSQGRGIIAPVDSGILWGNPMPSGGADHAVLVTGVEYDNAGNPVNYIINDTGTGNCGQAVPPATFRAALNDALHGNWDFVVTNHAIW